MKNNPTGKSFMPAKGENWDLFLSTFRSPTGSSEVGYAWYVFGGNKSGNARGTDDTSQQFPTHHMLPDGFFPSSGTWHKTPPTQYYEVYRPRMPHFMQKKTVQFHQHAPDVVFFDHFCIYTH